MPNLCIPRHEGVFLNFADKLMVVGGYVRLSRASSHIDNSRRKTTVEVFNGQKWSCIRPLNKHRGNAVGTVYNDIVYIIGGAGNQDGTIEIWEGNEWILIDIV